MKEKHSFMTNNKHPLKKAVGQTPAHEASEEPRKHCHKSVFCEVGSVVHKSLEQFNGLNDRPSCYNFDTSDTDA